MAIFSKTEQGGRIFGRALAGLWLVVCSAACDDTVDALGDRSRQEAEDARAAARDARDNVQTAARDVQVEARDAVSNARDDAETAHANLSQNLEAGVEKTKRVAKDAERELEDAADQVKVKTAEAAQSVGAKVDEADKALAQKIRGDGD